MGLDFVEDGRAFALADFDHDGRQEVFLKNRNGPQLRLLKNVMPSLPPSIAFRLRGRKSNRDAIGAAVTVETESGRQTRLLQAGSGFLSQHSKELFFGLGEGQGPSEGVDPVAERAGAAGSTASRPTTESGLKKESNRLAWSHSGQPNRVSERAAHHSGEANRSRPPWKRGCWLR